MAKNDRHQLENHVHGEGLLCLWSPHNPLAYRVNICKQIGVGNRLPSMNITNWSPWPGRRSDVLQQAQCLKPPTASERGIMSITRIARSAIVLAASSAALMLG